MKKTVAIRIFCALFVAVGVSLPFFKGNALAKERYFSNERYLFSHIGYDDEVKSLTKGKKGAHTSKIAVIDSGIEYDLADFLNGDGTTRVSPLSYSVDEKTTALESGYEVIRDSDTKAYHGTKVSSVIFSSHNSFGIDGLAPEAELIVIKMNMSDKGSYTLTQIKEAFAYALTIDGLDVINASFGFKGVENLLDDEIASLKEKGVLIVASSGNEGGSEKTYPACDERVIGVGSFDDLKNSSIDADYLKADFSSYGYDNVSVCAPGTMFTADIRSVNGYSICDGTSFSAPVVTSLIALYRSINPTSSFEEVRERLFSSSVDKGEYGRDYLFGYGAVNFKNMLFGEFGKVTFEFSNGETEVKTVCKIGEKTLPLQDYPFIVPTEKNFGGFKRGETLIRPYLDEVKDGDILTETLSDELTSASFDITFDNSGNAIVKGYYGREKTVFFKEIFKDFTPKKISPFAFKNIEGGRIIVSEGVETVSEYAFSGCKFDYLVLPSSIKTAEKSAVYSSEGKVYIYDGATVKSGFSFGSDVEITKGVTEIVFDETFEISSVKTAEKKGCVGEINSAPIFIILVAIFLAVTIKEPIKRLLISFKRRKDGQKNS